MHRLTAILCICFAQNDVARFTRNDTMFVPMYPQAHIIRRSRHHSAKPCIICRRQTSFKKRTFVLVDKSAFFVGWDSWIQNLALRYCLLNLFI